MEVIQYLQSYTPLHKKVGLQGALGTMESAFGKEAHVINTLSIIKKISFKKKMFKLTKENLVVNIFEVQTY